MKKRIFNILPFILFAGVLAVPSMFVAKSTPLGTFAEDKITGYVELGTTAVSGWECNQGAYCSGYYGGKNAATITAKNISDFNCFKSGNYTLKVWVTGFTNKGTNSVNVSTITSSGNVVSIGTAITGKLGSGQNFSTATKKETGPFEFTSSSTVTGLQIELGNKCVISKVRWEITPKSGDDPVVPPTPVGTSYTLVSDAATLNVGDTIVFGNAENNKVAGAFDTKYLKAETASFSSGVLTTSSANEITLGGNKGAFTLITESGQIIAGDNGSISLGETGSVWSISITDGSASISFDTGKLQYNSGSPRFTYYTSNQKGLEIYKKDGGEIQTFTVTYDGNGAASGEVADANSPYNKASTVTVKDNAFVPVTGKVFKEWNTAADGSGTSYQPDSTFEIFANTTLYAIWEDEYIPTGDTYTLVSNVSTLKAGDKLLLVGQKDGDYYAQSSLNTDYDCINIAKTVLNNGEMSFSGNDVKPFILGGSAGAWTFEYETGSKVGAFGAPNNKISTNPKQSGISFTWTMTQNSDKVTILNTKTDYGYLQFSGSNNRISNYKSTSNMTDCQIYAKSGHTKEVHLNAETVDLNAEQTAKVSVSECIGFEPTSYSWEITEGSEFVSIIAGQGTSEVTLTGLKEGEAKLIVTVDGVKAVATISVHEYKYDLLDKDSYFITTDGAIMAGDTSYVADAGFTDDDMWSFEKAYLGDNSYYLSSSAGYLSFSEDVLADGKNVSEIEITKTPINVWTVSYVEGQGYKVATQTTTQGLRSLATHEETWYAFTGNNYVKLMEAGSFDHIEVKALPTTKQYFVGDSLKPLNAHVYAVYTNGYEIEITSKIVWDKLTAGTKAYGKVTIGGVERNVELNGIKVFKGDASTFVVEGLQDTYPVGEKINKDFLTASITYKLAGEQDIEKTLTKNDYIVTPERIEEGTTKITVSLTKDPTVFIEKEITIKESSFIATPHVSEGDTVVIGTLGYNPYELTGGYELAYKEDKFSYDVFGSLPRGEMKFNVGKQDGYYTLQDLETGYYLQGDNSALKFYKPDYKSVYDKGDGHYEFNLNVTIGGETHLVTMKTTTSPDFTLTNVFSSMDYIGGYTDYIAGISDLENNKLIFNLYTKASGYVPVTTEVYLADWSFNNGVFQYAIETSSALPEECLFTLNYDQDYEEWVVSSKPHQDKQLYYNKDGKFGMYECGSTYTPIMLFRDNDKPLQSAITSLSVSLAEGLDTVKVGDAFPWTSALIVKANYSGGASKIIPVGGYTVVQMPDTSVIGKATGKISYGQNGHQITKEFTITVTGNTQAFDVVCKDPILVGETYQAHLDHYEVPQGEPLTWSVSDPTLASIDQNGNVTGLKPGYVDVIATSYDGTYSDFEHIRIYQQVESVTLNIHEIELKAGEKQTLTATVLPTDASNKKVTYSSSDSSIAAVDENTGEITAVSPGTATITCAAQNHPEENYDTCVVTVTEAPIIHVESISLDCDYKEIGIKDTFKLNASIKPDDAAVKNVTWSSNHENIATVDQNGLVKGVAAGECIITATTADGGLTASCTIKVKKTSPDVVHVTSVSLNKDSLDLRIGDVETLVATILPGDANDKTVEWKSSNENVVKVDYNGKVEAISKGTATITVTTNDGYKTATCEVVVRGEDGEIDVTGVTLNKTSATLEINDTLTLKATVKPTNATNKNVSWSSSNEDIVTVDENGKVTAIAAGTATITVTTEDGSKTATCEITVNGGSEENPSNFEEQKKTAIIIVAGSGTAAVGLGAGLGIGIPLRLRRKHKKLH